MLQKNNETANSCDMNKFTVLSQKLFHIKTKIQKLYTNHIHKRENLYTHPKSITLGKTEEKCVTVLGSPNVSFHSNRTNLL